MKPDRARADVADFALPRGERRHPVCQPVIAVARIDLRFVDADTRVGRILR